MKRKRKQTITEEWFNTLSHGLTALATIGGLVILIILGINNPKPWSLFSAIIYGVSLVVLYLSSTLYHGTQKEKVKHFFNVLDHCSIYFLIAGTYTPIVLVAIGGTMGWLFFSFQWGVALIGVFMKVFFVGKYKTLSVVMYALMGWVIVVKIDLLRSALVNQAFWLLFAGGVAYTLGIIFYALDSRLKLAHFIWHLFVIAGSVLHFLLMVMYVL